jgi:2-phosphosulfolactate phosphatase
VVEAALVEALGQRGAGVRFDWGMTAASTLARGDCAVAVVDVLSFTTAVSVATGRGIAVAPYPLSGDGAVALAARLDAALAVPRRRLSPTHPWSLSPEALLVAPHTPRLVLPSPNGSAIAAAILSDADQAPGAAEPGAGVPAVVAACIRNVAASARWLLGHDFGSVERPVWVIGAGERWPDGSLRPALEDLLGAGALADALARAGCGLSPEASAAARTFARTSDLAAAVEESASGRELGEMGYPGEAGIAAALDADDHASVTASGMFVPA